MDIHYHDKSINECAAIHVVQCAVLIAAYAIMILPYMQVRIYSDLHYINDRINDLPSSTLIVHCITLEN